jgi:hypothetical protein
MPAYDFFNAKSRVMATRFVAFDNAEGSDAYL